MIQRWYQFGNDDHDHHTTTTNKIDNNDCEDKNDNYNGVDDNNRSARLRCPFNEIWLSIWLCFNAYVSFPCVFSATLVFLRFTFIFIFVSFPCLFSYPSHNGPHTHTHSHSNELCELIFHGGMVGWLTLAGEHCGYYKNKHIYIKR